MRFFLVKGGEGAYIYKRLADSRVHSVAVHDVTSNIKMKLAIVFLISCLVGLSYQQRYIWPVPYAPRSHLMPLYYADGQPADYPVVDAAGIADDSIESKFVLGNALANAQPMATVTTTLTSTVVLKTPVISSCIPLTLFQSSSSSPISTAPCSSRRRRDIEDIDSIEPSLTQLETTAVADDAINTVAAKETPEIESSQTETKPLAPVQQRSFIAIRPVKTVTAYVTTTAFQPLVVQKTVSLAGSTALKCLPAGYQVCTEL